MGDTPEELKKVATPSERGSGLKFPLDNCDITSVSDETLTTLFNTEPPMHEWGGTRIVRISQTLILRGGVKVRPCEANIMNYVSAFLPVPKVHRILDIECDHPFIDRQCLMLVDFIEGKTVKDCWEGLSPAERSNIVTQVASLINMLQSIPLPQERPGPVGCETCLARGYWFAEMGGGPFSSKDELEAWFNHKLQVCKNFNQAPVTAPPFRFEKLVLVHHDITPRNLLRAPDGRVWLIDWGDAGVYPAAFDVAAIERKRHLWPEFTDMLLEKIPEKPAAVKQLHQIMFGLTTGQWL